MCLLKITPTDQRQETIPTVPTCTRVFNLIKAGACNQGFHVVLSLSRQRATNPSKRHGFLQPWRPAAACRGEKKRGVERCPSYIHTEYNLVSRYLMLLFIIYGGGCPLSGRKKTAPFAARKSVSGKVQKAEHKTSHREKRGHNENAEEQGGTKESGTPCWPHRSVVFCMNIHRLLMVARNFGRSFGTER